MGFLDFLLGISIWGNRNRRNKSEDNKYNTSDRGYNDGYFDGYNDCCLDNDCDCGYCSDHDYDDGYCDYDDRDYGQDYDDGYRDCDYDESNEW